MGERQKYRGEELIKEAQRWREQHQIQTMRAQAMSPYNNGGTDVDDLSLSTTYHSGVDGGSLNNLMQTATGLRPNPDTATETVPSRY